MALVRRSSLFPESEGPTLRGDICNAIVQGLEELQAQADYLLQVAQSPGFSTHTRATQIQALIHMACRFLAAAKRLCHECDLVPELLSEEERRLSQQIFLVPEEEVARVADEASLAFDSLFGDRPDDDGKSG